MHMLLKYGTHNLFNQFSRLAIKKTIFEKTHSDLKLFKSKQNLGLIVEDIRNLGFIKFSNKE